MVIVRSPLGLLALIVVFFASFLDATRIPMFNTNKKHHDGSHSDERHLSRRSATVDLQRNPSYAPNGPAAYARALSKWGAEVPEKLAQSLAAMRGPGDGRGDVEAVSFRDDREYLSRVGFGTPPQWFTVDLDTGSSDVWLYTTETRLSIAQDRRIFHINASSTAQQVPNATWYITYGDGSAAWGRVYRDVINLANLTFVNATIESASAVSASLAADRDLDGVFGLAYNLSSQTSPRQPGVLAAALLPRLAAPVFTADLRWRSPAGAYTFGYVDHARRAGELRYLNLTEGAQFWEFAYRGVRAGGRDRWHAPAGEGRWRAIADTGTTLLLMASEVAELYYADVPGARRNATAGGLWTYPCRNPTLPAFEIRFDDGFDVTIPGQFMNYTAIPDEPDRCMGGLQTWGYDDLAIFGDVFLKAVYAVFDVGQARIGFAPKKLNLTPS
ncbi:hypothetical protein VTJ83DRAFT_6909 [Remersonia thermophila]|uniref:Peptidase A1 domain-containing protein n=1 Tax=Remersonia thermophila TaxID=72144 RepID=A0ABR4D616_9PEZI